jgi:hypothetical protein
MSGGGFGSLGLGFVALLLRPLVWVGHCLLGRPRDSVLAILVAGAIGAIVINSLFLQRGPHPAPIFSQVQPSHPRDVPVKRVADVPVQPRADEIQNLIQQRSQSSTESTGAIASILPRQRPPEAPPRVQPAATRPSAPSKDAIAAVLGSTQQTTAVQRALSDYGYGQITPNGVVGPETRAAIERFERERRLPVTGQISERLTRELTALTGRTL